jgi:hypothetical protein
LCHNRVLILVALKVPRVRERLPLWGQKLLTHPGEGTGTDLDKEADHGDRRLTAEVSPVSEEARAEKKLDHSARSDREDPEVDVEPSAAIDDASIHSHSAHPASDDPEPVTETASAPLVAKAKSKSDVAVGPQEVELAAVGASSPLTDPAQG